VIKFSLACSKLQQLWIRLEYSDMIAEMIINLTLLCWRAKIMQMSWN